MTIFLTIAVVLLFIIIYAQKHSVDNLIDRIEDLEAKLEGKK